MAARIILVAGRRAPPGDVVRAALELLRLTRPAGAPRLTVTEVR